MATVLGNVAAIFKGMALIVVLAFLTGVAYGACVVGSRLVQTLVQP